MATVIRNNHDARAKIANRETFRNARGSFSGNVIDQPWQATRYIGYLPAGFHASLARADYVVYSYSTPIGWHIPGEGWHVPEVTYSATTSSRHQPILRSAVWGTLAVVPSWALIPESPTAAAILRSIRAGYDVPAKGRTSRVVNLVLNTGEAHGELDSNGRVVNLVPATKAA